jgi:hypothetical protein
MKADLYLPRPPVSPLRYIEPTGTEEYRDLRRYFVEVTSSTHHFPRDSGIFRSRSSVVLA